MFKLWVKTFDDKNQIIENETFEFSNLTTSKSLVSRTKYSILPISTTFALFKSLYKVLLCSSLLSVKFHSTTSKFLPLLPMKIVFSSNIVKHFVEYC